MPRVPQSMVPKDSLPERSEEHTSELQSRQYLVCRLLLEKNNQIPPLFFFSPTTPLPSLCASAPSSNITLSPLSPPFPPTPLISSYFFHYLLYLHHTTHCI